MEREAVKRLFMQHYARMQRVARTLLYDVQESEDVCQDIFEAIEHSPLTIDHFAASNGTANNGGDSINNGQWSMVNGQSLTDDRLSDIVEFVVSHLSEREQRIFNLRFTEGYSYEEIAAAEGISKVAVWKRLSHAITEVKKHFNPKSL